MTADDVKAGDRIRVKDLTNLIKKVRGTLGTVGGDPQPGWCIVSLDVMGGKEFAFDYDQIEPVPAPSPDTPEPVPNVAEDREEVGIAGTLHEEIACHLDSLPLPDWGDADAIAGALRPIIDRHTARAINHAVLAQDSALEVALRERDEFAALVNAYAAERAPDGMESLAKDRDRWFDRTTAAESALAAEQREHAETRKDEREACAKVCDERAALYRRKAAKPGMADLEPGYSEAEMFERCAVGAEYAASEIRARSDKPGILFNMIGDATRARAALSDTQEKAHG